MLDIDQGFIRFCARKLYLLSICEMTDMRKRKLLRHEILLALAIKLSLLFGLWMLCFSHPIDKQLTPPMIENHLITTSKN